MTVNDDHQPTPLQESTYNIMEDIAADFLDANLISYDEYSNLNDSITFALYGWEWEPRKQNSPKASGVEIVPYESGDMIVDEPEHFEPRFIKKESIGKPTPFDTDPVNDPEGYIWGTMRSICRDWRRKGLITEEEFHNLLAF